MQRAAVPQSSRTLAVPKVFGQQLLGNCAFDQRSEEAYDLIQLFQAMLRWFSFSFLLSQIDTDIFPIIPFVSAIQIWKKCRRSKVV